MQKLIEAALAYPAAVAENPFGPESICIRIGAHGPIFAEFMPERSWVSFRCEAPQGLAWRAEFPSHVRRGYHCPPVQQPYTNTVTLDGTVPDAILLAMLEHSYARVLSRMPRARRAELQLSSFSGENSPV